jgi:hypothetical protein
MSTKSHIHETYGTLKKTSFCTKGYAEIHKQRPFFDIEKGIWKILRLKIQIVCSCFGAPSIHGIFFLKKTKISIFGRISKFLELIVSRQVLAVLDNFRQILLHWQWLTTCPKFTRNLQNLIIFEPSVQT